MRFNVIKPIKPCDLISETLFLSPPKYSESMKIIGIKMFIQELFIIVSHQLQQGNG